MQQLLIVALLLLLSVGARADSTVDALPDAALPLQTGDCLYLDQTGVDTKLCVPNIAPGLNLNTSGANTMRGNWTGSSGNDAANAMPSCPNTGTNHLNYVSGTGIICGTSSAPAPKVAVFATPTPDPGGVTGTTALMQGLGASCHLTPTLSGNLHLVINATAGNGTALGGALIALNYGTGSAPANGAAVTGTQLSSIESSIGSTITTRQDFTTEGYVTGLTLNTAVWFDLRLSAVTGGTTASVFNVTCFGEEL